MSYDANQRFISFVPGGNGILYAIQADGALLWYNHTGWAAGTTAWAAGSGLVIGAQWQQFTTVLASADGQFFCLKPNGDLLWYKYKLTNANTGAGSWDPASGSVIGHQFNKFARIFGGFDGVIYGVDNTGELYWYRYSGGNGSVTWGANSGAAIGGGFLEYPWLWADPDGVIYGARQGSQLAWFRHLVPNLNTGAGSWVNGGSPMYIGTGWGDTSQKVAWSNASGTIYSVTLDNAQNIGQDNILTWYRLKNSGTINSSGVAWYTGNGVTVGTGFTQQASAALQGYPSVLSTPQGGSVNIQVSTTFPTYNASVVQLAPSTGTPAVVQPSASYPGRLQNVASTYRSTGCGWSTDFTVATTSTWQSGIYSAQLQSTFGNQHDVVFVVRPAAPQNQIAVVLATNTYHAYNTWGGHDQYTDGQLTGTRQVSLLRPSVTTIVSPSGYINHTLYSDLMLYNWMSSNNIDYDVYTDADVDGTGTTWMSSYKAIVLGSHPEYWTQQARQNLIAYLAGGGRVIATGGNGIYEEVTYTPDGNAVIFRTPAGERNLFEDQDEFEADILGIAYNPGTYMDFYPYEVQTNHAFLNGTGLTVGSTFGASGANIAASGWEVDWAVAGITGQVVIAQGQNPNGGGGMCYVPMANGGWAFTTGSISFNGSIPGDPAIQKILANVFAAAVL